MSIASLQDATTEELERRLAKAHAAVAHPTAAAARTAAARNTIARVEAELERRGRLPR